MDGNMKKLIATLIVTLGMFNSGSALAFDHFDHTPQIIDKCAKDCMISYWSIFGVAGYWACRVHCVLIDWDPVS